MSPYKSKNFLFKSFLASNNLLNVFILDALKWYFILTPSFSPFLKEKCPSVVHVDNTARPQVVFQEDNPKYFELLNKYIKKTGNPVLINTSFNHHEEPIVNSPYDAVRSLIKGNVDFLAIGNHLVHKIQ